jgi:hypothetical protein
MVSLTRDEVCIGNWIYQTLTRVTANNYDNLTDLRTLKVSTTHIKPFQSSLAVAWYRLSTADVPLSLDSRTVPDLSYQLSSQLQLSTDSTNNSESESELLYDWRFTADQVVLASSPLRRTTRDFYAVIVLM